MLASKTSLLRSTRMKCLQSATSVMERLKCLLELRMYPRRVEEFVMLFHSIYQSNVSKYLCVSFYSSHFLNPFV